MRTPRRGRRRPRRRGLRLGPPATPSRLGTSPPTHLGRRFMRPRHGRRPGTPERSKPSPLTPRSLAPKVFGEISHRSVYSASMKKRIAAAGCLILTGLAAWGAWTPATGELVLSVVDQATRQETPARVEVLDESGTGFVAEDAIPVGGD